MLKCLHSCSFEFYMIAPYRDPLQILPLSNVIAHAPYRDPSQILPMSNAKQLNVRYMRLVIDNVGMHHNKLHLT